MKANRSAESGNGPRRAIAAKAAEEKAAREAQEKKRVAQAKKRNKLVQGGKLGRPRKLTPEQLRRGVEEYFASISYQEPVTREEFIILKTDKKTGAVTYQLDAMGHRCVRVVPVLNAAGKPLTRTVYTEAPGDFGLCNFLKISRDTWERYGRAVELLEARREQGTGDGGDEATGNRQQATGDGGDGGTGDPAPTDEEMREALDYAEIYTLARGRVCAYLESAAETRGGRGAQFKLERIYGLTEKKDVHVDAGGSIEAFLRSLDEDG